MRTNVFGFKYSGSLAGDGVVFMCLCSSTFFSRVLKLGEYAGKEAVKSVDLAPEDKGLLGIEMEAAF